jgi:hypothetical protein
MRTAFVTRLLVCGLAFVGASLTQANAQALVNDLVGFKTIPTPQGVVCRDSLGERQCEARQTVRGKEYSFAAAFLEQRAGAGNGRAFMLAVSPLAAAKIESFAKLYSHYAARLELHENEALIGAIPSLAELPELCARSPSARNTDGVCLLAVGDSLVRTASGDTDQSGISFVRQWTAK